MKKKAKKPSVKPSAANVKKAKFAQGVFSGKTQRQAAKDAGYKGKPANVDTHASRLMVDPVVAAEVDVLQERGRASAIATRDEVMQLLTAQMRANVDDLLKTMGDEDRPFTRIDLEKARKAGLLGLAESVEIDKDGCIKVSFPGKHGAIDRLAKMLSWFAPEKLLHEHRLRPAAELPDIELMAEYKKTVAKLKEG